MIRISQMKLPCGHSREALEGKIAKTLRLRGGQPFRYEIRRHSVDARKKPQLFDIYTVDVDAQMGQKAERKLIAKLRNFLVFLLELFFRPEDPAFFFFRFFLLRLLFIR